MTRADTPAHGPRPNGGDAEIGDSSEGLLRLKFRTLETCPLCDSHKFEREKSIHRLDVEFIWVRCEKCKLVFMNPQLTPDSLVNLFSSERYWKAEKPDEVVTYPDYLAENRSRELQSRRRLRLIQEACPPPARLLEIGCADGSFLVEAQKLGYRVEGVDISRTLVLSCIS